ncbi:MAG: hypothetical protein CM15mP23_09020 [Cryomorphaceae bacterium]|nr:MAG: hypothetical protein CM15mP23_09020 [Cryomorphaceae bacterium]
MWHDGITQVDVDQAYLIGYSDGASSVTPEDGIGQADLDAAYADGVASVTPEDGIGQADVDAAYADGVASVIPEDGIGQADVDAAYADGVASVDITSDNSTIADEYYLYGFNDGQHQLRTILMLFKFYLMKHSPILVVVRVNLFI